MRFKVPKLPAALIAAAIALLGHPPRASAQTCFSCGGGGGESVPTVTILPSSGSWTGSTPTTSQSVSAKFCQTSGTPIPGNEVITLDGVTQGFTDGSVVSGCFTATGTLTLSNGSHTLAASLTNSAGTGSRTAAYTYTYNAPPPPAAVVVTPHGGTGRANSAGGTQLFRVRNADTQSRIVRMSALCTGGTLASCAPGQDSLVIAAGDSATASVSHTGSGGTVYLKAWRADATTLRDSGWVSVPTATAAASEGMPGEAGDQGTVERGMCLRLPAGSAVYECGDLRIVHALPGARVLNKQRQPLLVYSSQEAAPSPVVAVSVLPSTSVTAVDLSLQITGGSTYPAHFAGALSTTTPTRLALQLPALPTGLYDYTLQVTLTLSTGATTTYSTVSGTLPVVNRAASYFGAGWWMAGLETIVPSSGGRLLWIDGDGSTRVYQQVSGSTTKWAAARFDGPDTVVARTGGGWARAIVGGDSIVFDAFGKQVQSVNRLGVRTTFAYDGSSRLSTITFAGESAYTFQFLYSTGGVLQIVEAPGAQAGLLSSRIARLVADGSGRITAISNPDQRDTTKFAYGDATARITRLTDARKFATDFGYDAGYRLSSATWTDPGSHQTVGYTYTAAESRGLPAIAGPRPGATDVRTTFNGPRADVGDTASFAINRWGAPTATRNAFGKETLIVRGDPTWPALVTRVTYSNGRVVTALYDGAARLVAQTDWSRTSASGRRAVTTYEWDPTWSEITRITLPEGEAAQRGYDAYGRLAWVQPGSDLASRTTLAYKAAGTVQAGLLSSATLPVPAGQTQHPVQTFEYGAHNNLSATVSPLQFRTEFYADNAGRDTLVITPTDSVQTAGYRVQTRTTYDAADRVAQTSTYGPAVGGITTAQTLLVTNTYDEAGNLLSVARSSSPDPAAVGTVTNGFDYDAAGRKVADVAADGLKDLHYLDAAGNDTLTVTRRSLSIRMAYDAMNRLVKRVSPAVTYAAQTRGVASAVLQGPLLAPLYAPYAYTVAGDSVALAYDDMGNLKEADNGDAQVTRTWRADGLLDTEIQRIRTLAAGAGSFGVHVDTLAYQYDLNGRRSALVLPTALAAGLTSSSTRYAYEPQTGLLSAVTDALNNVVSFTYDPAGQLKSITRPGGIGETFEYDAEGRLLHNQVTNASTSPRHYSATQLRDLRMHYDAAGRLLSSSNPVGTHDSFTGTYSALGALSTSSFQSDAMLDFQLGGTYTSTDSTQHDALGNLYHATNTTSFYGDAPGWWILTKNEQGSSTTSPTTYHFQGGTGRLAYTVSFSAVDTTYYDAEGNAYFTTRGSGAGSKAADRAAYYSAVGQLAAADVRSLTSLSSGYTTLEEYRYDALGRRVFVRAQRWCSAGMPNGGECLISKIRRTLWDGDQELFEIQMPGQDTSSYLETDTGPTQLGALVVNSQNYDPNPYFGQVLYTSGLGLDQPVSIIRMGYADLSDSTGVFRTLRTVPPFALFPLWNTRSQAEGGTFADGGKRSCQAVGGYNRCIYVGWPIEWYAYARSNVRRTFWHGTLLEDKRDEANTYYRRNRYYDPASGRFTQEDPAGLAGGLNAYGFANGNPISFSDPYGLCPKCRRLLGAAGIIALADGPEPGPADVLAAGVLLVAAGGYVWYNATHDDEPAAGPAHGPERSLDDPESLRGATPEEVKELIPDTWVETPTRKSEGTRWSDPRTKGTDQVRVMPGNPADPTPAKQGPYVRVSKGGKSSGPIPLSGNPNL